jgi:uncharacterized NAD(P)/FAD-binding protein YdhS
MAQVVIIGGGFSGTVTAVNLARLTDAPLSVTVVNSGQPLGRGVAYGTRRPEHLLNVVARNMSALADQPEHFLEWLGTRSDFADIPPAELREQFVPRRVYGDYLQALFLWYARAFADGKKVRIDRRDAEALDIVPGAERVKVRLADGATLEADKVVLATGNPAPSNPAGVAIEHPRYFPDPWCGWEKKLGDPSEDVALLGTGLTMVDAFLTLNALGWRGKVYALSRNGLLPLAHFKGQDYPGFPEGDPLQMNLEQLEGSLMEHCERLRQSGINPAILVDKLRPYTQRIWQHFTVSEKRRFLSDLRSRWNVTRHRVPQAVHRELDAAQETGRLQVLACRIASISPRGDQLRIHVQGKNGEQDLIVGALVNCTGPAEGFDAGPVLYQNLIVRGLVSADDVGVGIRATADFAAIDREGKRSSWLMVLGPPLRGMLWETTAVPELRAQAFRVAEVIVADMPARRAEIQAVEQTYSDVLEYSI